MWRRAINASFFYFVIPKKTAFYLSKCRSWMGKNIFNLLSSFKKVISTLKKQKQNRQVHVVREIVKNLVKRCDAVLWQKYFTLTLSFLVRIIYKKKLYLISAFQKYVLFYNWMIRKHLSKTIKTNLWINVILHIYPSYKLEVDWVRTYMNCCVFFCIRKSW